MRIRTPLGFTEPAVAFELAAEQVRQDVARILRPQCTHLSETEFDNLVNSVADSPVARAIVRSTPPHGTRAPLDLPDP
jgi:hypothetical protein